MANKHIHSTRTGGRIDSLKCMTVPKCKAFESSPAISSSPLLSENLGFLMNRGQHGQEGAILNNCLIWAAGRATLDAILRSCQFFRCKSCPQFVFHETSLPISGGKSNNTARACFLPKMCCKSAIAVTSSTPAGISASSSAPPIHQSALPMRIFSSAVICRVICLAGRPSAMLRNPVMASFLTDHRANVFHGVVLPLSFCSPSSKE
mmetsp:Transcript_123479/g.193731  ORF Transcript_123479/g.193731 Transcript_123479/m.193731 type:complete len:206 (-) Transcript_123479:480-1097(-)